MKKLVEPSSKTPLRSVSGPAATTLSELGRPGAVTGTRIVVLDSSAEREEDHPADADRVPLELVGLAIETQMAGAIEHLQVAQWVLVDDDEIGFLAGLDRADLVVEPHELGAI